MKNQLLFILNKTVKFCGALKYVSVFLHFLLFTN